MNDHDYTINSGHNTLFLKDNVACRDALNDKMLSRNDDGKLEMGAIHVSPPFCSTCPCGVSLMPK